MEEDRQLLAPVMANMSLCECTSGIIAAPDRYDGYVLKQQKGIHKNVGSQVERRYFVAIFHVGNHHASARH